MKSLSCVWLFATPWTVAHQASLSIGFSRQESWSGLPFPSPGDLPNPGIEAASLMSPACIGRWVLYHWATWEALQPFTQREITSLRLKIAPLQCHQEGHGKPLCRVRYRFSLNSILTLSTVSVWTWVWVDSGSWWWTGRPGVLWFMGLQRVRHNWATELNWNDLFL